jgi:hypothetical protein
MLILLRKKGRPKCHINKVSSGHFRCNVQIQISVDYDRDMSLLSSGPGALYPGVKRSGREVDHSSHRLLPRSRMVAYTSTSRGVVLN